MRRGLGGVEKNGETDDSDPNAIDLGRISLFFQTFAQLTSRHFHERVFLGASFSAAWFEAAWSLGLIAIISGGHRLRKCLKQNELRG